MDLRSTPAFKYYFWAGLSLILIFTVIKPAGTDDTGLTDRFVIWTIQIALLLPMLIGLHILLQSSNVFNHLNPWLKLTLSGIMGAVLFVPFGLGIDYVFNLDDWEGITNLGGALPIIAEEIVNTLLPVTLTWIAINAPRILELNFKELNASVSPAAKPETKEAAVKASNAFLSNIPTEIGNDIIYLKSELHYVRVVTSLGERLVLFNLKDAIADLETFMEGIQTHRSYWVSGRHIESMLSDKNTKFIHTTSGQKIPVSRRKLSETRQYMQRLER
jgi:hypothetical protein